MATTREMITTTPTELTSLVSGTRYSGICAGQDTILVAAVTGGGTPDTTDPAWPVQPFDKVTISPASGEAIWVWAARSGSVLVYDEVA